MYLAIDVPLVIALLARARDAVALASDVFAQCVLREWLHDYAVRTVPGVDVVVVADFAALLACLLFKQTVELFKYEIGEFRITRAFAPLYNRVAMHVHFSCYRNDCPAGCLQLRYAFLYRVHEKLKAYALIFC